jgi:dephospho-CoA kinase
MLRVGLTGGIGSGKTTVAALFRRLGVETLDADRIARELIEPGRPALAEIARLFGPQSLQDDGSLIRPRLARRVFDSPLERKRLEDLLHPLVYDTMAERIGSFTGPYCVLEIPLLVETGRQSFVDRTLVVDCPESLRFARIKARTGQDDTAIAKVLASQASRAERLACADELIVNSADNATLCARIAILDRFYRGLRSR